MACTIRPSTIKHPIYGYNPQTELESDYLKPDTIAVMAVDNLPCELPRDASEGFGKTFIEKILPHFLMKIKMVFYRVPKLLKTDNLPLHFLTFKIM